MGGSSQYYVYFLLLSMTTAVSNAYYNQLVFAGLERTREARQLQLDCLFPPPDYPPECNSTFARATSLGLIQNKTMMLLDSLNNIYQEFCIPKCIDPLMVAYRNCSSFAPDLVIQSFRNGVCGKIRNDFCTVRCFRSYPSDMIIDVSSLTTACGLIRLYEFNCTSPSQTCRQLLSEFNTKLGCCTVPFLGNITSCGVTTQSSCISAIESSSVSPSVVAVPSSIIATPTPSVSMGSGSNAICLAMFPIFLAILGTLL